MKRNTERVNQEHKNGYLREKGKERVEMTGTDPDLSSGLGNIKI